MLFFFKVYALEILGLLSEFLSFMFVPFWVGLHLVCLGGHLFCFGCLLFFAVCIFYDVVSN